jgi:hypothetical protein
MYAVVMPVERFLKGVGALVSASRIQGESPGMQPPSGTVAMSKTHQQ